MMRYHHISQRHTKTRETQLGTCKAVWKRKLSLYRALLFAQRENDQTPQRFDMRVALGESCTWRCSTPWQSVASFHVLLVPSAAFRPFTPGSGTGFAWRPWEGRGCFPTGERSSHILQEGHDEISERQRTIPQKRSRTKLTFSLDSTQTLEYWNALKTAERLLMVSRLVGFVALQMRVAVERARAAESATLRSALTEVRAEAGVRRANMMIRKMIEKVI